jgi:hypothetical protein
MKSQCLRLQSQSGTKQIEQTTRNINRENQTCIVHMYKGGGFELNTLCFAFHFRVHAPICKVIISTMAPSQAAYMC